MPMNTHVFFCIGYRASDISNKFWLENLELDHKDIKILDDYGVAELWEKLDKFIADNNLKQTLYSVDDSEYLIGAVYEWDVYEDDEKLVMSQQEYQRQVQRLTSIFSFEPSIYFGTEYY